MDVFKVFENRKKKKIIEALQKEKEEVYFLGIEDTIFQYLFENICTHQGRKVDGMYCVEGKISEAQLKELANRISLRTQEFSPEYREYFDENNIDLIAHVIKDKIILEDMYDMIVYREMNNESILIGIQDPEYIPF